MGDLVKGAWRPRRFPARPRQAISSGPIRRSATGSRPTARRGRRGEGGFKAEPGRYHLYRVARLPLGASHPDLPQAQGAGGHDLALGRQLADRRARLDLRPGARRHPRPDLRREASCSEFYLKARARLQRPRHRAGAVGQGDEHDRQQRIVRNHPHVQQRLRRRRRGAKATIIPQTCSGEIDALNARIYATVNNGVYRAGFATTQEAYEEAFRALFETLDCARSAAARRSASSAATA